MTKETPYQKAKRKYVMYLHELVHHRSKNQDKTSEFMEYEKKTFEEIRVCVSEMPIEEFIGFILGVKTF